MALTRAASPWRARVALGAIVDGFKNYPTVAMKYLSKFGLVKSEPDKAPVIDRQGWYPLDKWLLAYEGIANEIGYNSLYTIGRKIPENAQFPPHINDVYSAVGSIDAATYPAAVGAGNVEVSQRVADVCLGALAQAGPVRLGAAWQGTRNNVLLGISDWLYYEKIDSG
jgi:hypothetical protein